MIIKIFNFFKKNIKKSQLILFGLGLVLTLTGIISWNNYFSKFYIFNKQEKYLLETVKDYYQFHSIYLPKENSIKTLTLEKLYEMKQIDTINEPKSHKLCDTSSWVKVYNDGNKYHYYVYLKCGKYESSTDHEGPIITLNGNDTIYVSLNKEYEELGVEKVVDNIDGDIDKTKVIIDNSKVNTKKVGEYNVSYTVRDTLNNETVMIRKVIVVKNLTDIVKDSTNETNYYQGMVTNNYLLFSGMLYRIINVNDDGTVKIISNENLNNLRYDSATYENSNVDLYLSEEYLNILHDQSYLVDTEYCSGTVENYNNIDSSCSNKITRKVALLSYYDLKKSSLDNKSYLCNNVSYLILNRNATGFMQTNNTSDNCISTGDTNILPAIRPVITLKANLIIISGNGTYNNPYKLNDYNFGKQQDKINTRLIGEYVNYSGNVFRIIKQDENTRLIMIGGLEKKLSGTNNTEMLTVTVPKVDNYTFNIKDTDNPGYIINNNYIDYINDSYIINTTYDIPTNEKTKNYKDYTLKQINAKMVLPKTYDLFSSVQTINHGYMYLYLDKSLNNNQVFNININNGLVFEDESNSYGEYSVKPVITVKGDLTIKSGKGTIYSPYYINK